MKCAAWLHCFQHVRFEFPSPLSLLQPCQDGMCGAASAVPLSVVGHAERAFIQVFLKWGFVFGSPSFPSAATNH